MAIFDDLVATANPTLVPEPRNLRRVQGSSWEIRHKITVNGVAMDWTGCTPTCQIRTRAGVLVFAFSSISLSSVGVLNMTATPTNTATLPVGGYVYDVDVVSASSRRLTLMAGVFRIESQVTT